MVHPSEELDVPIGQISTKISGPIQPAARNSEGIGHEALRGQPRSADVSTRHPDPTDVELPGHSHRDGLAKSIQHVDLGVGDRLADWRVIRSVDGRNLKKGNTMAFGRPVEVPQDTPLAVQPLTNFAGHSEPVSRNDDLRKRVAAVPLPRKFRQRLYDRTRQHHAFDTGRFNKIGQGCRVAPESHV